MSTVIFGDIHGCIRPFEQLLDTIQPCPEKDRIILLGDIMDRGPDAFAVWQRILQLKESFGDRLTLLRGNHESYWLEKDPSFSLWMLHLRVGRNDTLRSFTKRGQDTAAFLDWLSRNVRLFYRDEHIQCVHAGILIEPIELNDENTLIHDHQGVLKNRYHGRLTITGHIALDEPTWFAGDQKTVKALRTGKDHVLPAQGVLCIDTGCGKGGKLTAIVIDGERYALYQAAEKEEG